MLKFKQKLRQRHFKQKGFTLVELMVATGLMSVVMAMTMSFMNDYSHTTNREIKRSELSEQLRANMNRVEKELLEGAKVVDSVTSDGTTYETSANTVVFEVPLYSDSGFLVVDEDSDKVVDIVVLEVVDDTTANSLNLRSSMTKPQKMRFTLIPDNNSNRSAITKQVIAKNLMPKTGDNYDCPTTAIGCSANSTFTFLNQDGQPVDPTSDADTLSEITQVRVLLWAETEFGSDRVTARKEFEVRLRNALVLEEET